MRITRVTNLVLTAAMLAGPALAQNNPENDLERPDNLCQTYFRETAAQREAALVKEFARLEKINGPSYLIDNPLFKKRAAQCLARGLELVLQTDAFMCLEDPRLQAPENAETVKRHLAAVQALCLSYGPARGPSVVQRLINKILGK